jgi:MoaA/NifB/PqqE/SkfB family radical SAM enzyme
VSRTLPLLTLYLTDRCNSRCVSCDHWRTGRTDLTLESLQAWLQGMGALRTQVVQLSGGEPLLHPQWAEMADLLRGRGVQVWLLTSGLSLAKHARAVAERCASVTVSMDGTDAPSYAAVRGLDAFEAVCEGVRQMAAVGRPVGLRITVQRRNFRELPRFVTLARRLGARGVSFLAADVINPHAFGRILPGGFANDVALQPADLPELSDILDRMERDLPEEFASGFIAESPRKLRRVAQYFAAVCGQVEFPEVRCNAPEFSAVIESDGQIRPCFFIQSPDVRAGADLAQAVCDERLQRQRLGIQQGRLRECAHCVCSMWRDPPSAGGSWQLHR